MKVTPLKIVLIVAALLIGGYIARYVYIFVFASSESRVGIGASGEVLNEETDIAVLAQRTNEEWKKVLSPRAYKVLRENGTEIPFTSELLHENRKGTYVTADCGEPVFRSEQKFDSGTGWPSFYAPIASSSVALERDTSLGQDRIAVNSPICKSHIGHLFHDAPQTPTGDRYCLNGSALRFIPD